MTDYTLTAETGGFALTGVAAARAYVTGVSDGVIAGETPTYKWYPDGAMAETVVIADTPSPQTIYNQAVLEGVIHADLMAYGVPVAIVDTLEIADALAVLRGLVVLDGLKITDALDPVAKYGIMLTQALRFSDALASFFAMSITEGMVVADNLKLNFYATAAITDGIALFDLLANKLLIRVDLDETIDLDDTQILKMIFQGDALLDGVNIQAAYVGPDGGITTWVINSRTGSVTEYRNWQFSSFGQLGNSFVAAGPGGDGLYLLEGQRDDGANIVARMRGGILELNGSRFTSFKGAYLGMRSRDDAAEYLLKLIDPTGREYIYAVRARDMRTTKVNMGKGLRGRYWQWELMSLAADFDLDAIEFVPLMQHRRV